MLTQKNSLTLFVSIASCFDSPSPVFLSVMSFLLRQRLWPKSSLTWSSGLSTILLSYTWHEYCNFIPRDEQEEDSRRRSTNRSIRMSSQEKKTRAWRTHDNITFSFFPLFVLDHLSVILSWKKSPLKQGMKEMTVFQSQKLSSTLLSISCRLDIRGLFFPSFHFFYYYWWFSQQDFHFSLLSQPPLSLSFLCIGKKEISTCAHNIY